MNTEAQRIAIAEACGFTPFLNCHNQPFDPPRWLNPARDMTFGTLPNYLNSLDAMHEAEKVIEEKCLCVEYVNTLRDFAIYPKTLSRYGLTHATAVQRAEAFLRTIGKWSENLA